jgi:hypothetical protein
MWRFQVTIFGMGAQQHAVLVLSKCCTSFTVSNVINIESLAIKTQQCGAFVFEMNCRSQQSTGQLYIIDKMSQTQLVHILFHLQSVA